MYGLHVFLYLALAFSSAPWLNLMLRDKTYAVVGFLAQSYSTGVIVKFLFVCPQNAIIVSEGKSILQVRIRVPLITVARRFDLSHSFSATVCLSLCAVYKQQCCCVYMNLDADPLTA